MPVWMGPVLIKASRKGQLHATGSLSVDETALALALLSQIITQHTTHHRWIAQARVNGRVAEI